jgi:hypothetical protein
MKAFKKILVVSLCILFVGCAVYPTQGGYLYYPGGRYINPWGPGFGRHR